MLVKDGNTNCITLESNISKNDTFVKKTFVRVIEDSELPPV